MRLVRHPLVDQDFSALVDYIIDVTGGDFDAAGRRLYEVDDLITDIITNSLSGVRLAPPLEGWLVRHGGRCHRLTIVFRADLVQDCIFVALVAFGEQDWLTESETRKSFGR
jgi:hypothetical protein